MMRLAGIMVLPFAVCAGSISGTVFLKAGQTPKACARVEVVARATSDSRVLRSAVTDEQGHYTLAGIDGRFSVSASFPGYLPRAVAGGGRAPVFDIAADERLEAADFELLPGGVITGRITDPQGTPMDGVLVIVSPASRTNPKGAPILANTDDRGIYRVFGLDPGRYVVFAKPAQWIGSGRPAETYYRDTGNRAVAEAVETVSGGVASGIDIVLKPAPVFRLAGRVMGIDPQELPSLRIVAAAAAGAPHSAVSYSVRAEADAAFGFDLPAGPYTVTAMIQPAGRILARARVDLSANIADLLLRPARPGRLSGRVVFAAGQRSPKPREVRLRAVESSGTESLDVVARAPEYSFASGEIVTGTYTFELASPESAYIVRVLKGPESSTVLSGAEFAVAEGGDTALQVFVGLDRTQVSGVVSGPSGIPLPHAKVAITPEGGTAMKPQSVQADQKGRFILDGIIPGDYLLCAWPRMDDETLERPAIWQQAGDAVKRLSVGANNPLAVALSASVAPER